MFALGSIITVKTPVTYYDHPEKKFVPGMRGMVTNTAPPVSGPRRFFYVTDFWDKSVSCARPCRVAIFPANAKIVTYGSGILYWDDNRQVTNLPAVGYVDLLDDGQLFRPYYEKIDEEFTVINFSLINTTWDSEYEIIVKAKGSYLCGGSKFIRFVSKKEVDYILSIAEKI